MSGVLLLACGDGTADRLRPLGVPARPVPRLPGAAEVDPLLGDATTVLVAGDDADLAAVVLRLLRTDRLGSTAIGYLPQRRSAVTALWRLPVDPRAVLDAAVAGAAPTGVPLIRDDNGGVLLGRGEIAPVDGVAYCDDTKVLHGVSAGLVVTPAPGAGLAVRVRRGPGRRVRVARGRALQLGCAASRPVRDGQAHPRAVQRWTWYRHTADLQLLGVGAAKRITLGRN